VSLRDDPKEAVHLVGQFIREVGFPVVVAVYMLFRADGFLVDLVRDTGESVRLLRELAGKPSLCLPPACSPRDAGLIERRPRLLEVGSVVVELPQPRAPLFRSCGLRQSVTWR
jgi:hypothetical protein